MTTEDINLCLDELSKEAKELYLGDQVQYIDGAPSAIEFLRNWVCPNKPVIIRNAIDHWPALQRWQQQSYLRDRIGSKEVTVTATPNGYADAVCENKFIMPEEKTMIMNSFLDVMETPSDYNGVYYVQKQNSNFTDEFSEIIGDAEKEIPWASEALGKCPDAVNFWMGDGRAVTSVHKDHYENLYCVITGQKHFILHPPTDLAYIPYGDYPAAVYKETQSGQFDIIDQPDIGTVPWISIDPLKPDLKLYPQYGKSQSLHVTLKAGEMLYLPSLWIHHVQQSHACIAVNFWYDMEYDIKYNYFKFVENLLAKCNKNK